MLLSGSTRATGRLRIDATDALDAWEVGEREVGHIDFLHDFIDDDLAVILKPRDTSSRSLGGGS